MNFKGLVWIAIALALASVSILIFPAAVAGYGNINEFGEWLLLAAVVLLVVLCVGLRRPHPSLVRSIVGGAAAGAVSTVAVEIVRVTMVHMGYMSGKLPELMGVVLLNRSALGPSLASNIAGWGYHFWYGASFGIIYTLILGTRRRWAGIPYAVAIATCSLVSPVVTAMGAGFFGLQYSIGFPVTVYLAELAYGVSLGFLAPRFTSTQPSMLVLAFRAPAPVS